MFAELSLWTNTRPRTLTTIAIESMCWYGVIGRVTFGAEQVSYQFRRPKFIQKKYASQLFSLIHLIADTISIYFVLLEFAQEKHFLTTLAG